MKKKNLWILTEERPKREVIGQILEMFLRDRGICGFIDAIRILPILENGRFAFLYEVTGIKCNQIEKIFLKTVSGYSSFVDFLVFYEDKCPTQASIPLYAIEETKTDDGESRNTGAYQRGAKFIFIERYYPTIKKVMLYNLQVEQKTKPTESNIFGMRLLLTLGVEIQGKKLDKKIFRKFSSVDEIIAVKNRMRPPPKGNVPVQIEKKGDTITVSGRLVKSGTLTHDPNIGMLSLIGAGLRKTGWEGEIVITRHGLRQANLKPKNKFVIIAKHLNMQIEGLALPPAGALGEYWKYERTGEKLGTILIHLAVENFTTGKSIFENHAGCEKGYFIPKTGQPIQLGKYADREAYKAGDKNQIIHIPDLILEDCERQEIINIEGKKYQFRAAGIEELNNYDAIEDMYLKEHYPNYKIIRTVVLYGGKEEEVVEIEVGFLLNEEGTMLLGVMAPAIFQDAIERLLDFWSA